MASPRPLLNANRLTDYLLGSLDFRGGNWLEQDEDALERPLGWYRDLAGAGRAGAPLAVVADLGALVLQRSDFAFCSLTDFEHWPESERRTRLDYENLFLNRLLRSPAFVRAAEIVAVAAEVAEGRPAEARARRAPVDAQVVRVIELILDAMDPLPALPFRFSPSALREVSLVSGVAAAFRAAAAARERFESGEGGENFFRDRTAAVVSAFSGVAIGEVFREEQFHELENFHAYESPLARRKGRWLKAVQRIVGEVNLRRRHVAPEAAEAETELEDEGYYPTGGLAELTNRGSFENLVPSEAVYMEDRGSEDVDLFTVRHVEGELLFYMRDSGQLRRRRRTVHLVVEGGEPLRIKHRHHRFALDVLILGFALRLADDLARVFERDSLRTCIHVITAGAGASSRGTGASSRGADEDRADERLLKLLLTHEIRRGDADVTFTPAVVPAEIVEKGRKNYLLHFAPEGGGIELVESARALGMETMRVSLSGGEEPPGGARSFSATRPGGIGGHGPAFSATQQGEIESLEHGEDRDKKRGLVAPGEGRDKLPAVATPPAADVPGPAQSRTPLSARPEVLDLSREILPELARTRDRIVDWVLGALMRGE